MPVKKEEVIKATRKNIWDFSNEILYKLCNDNFEHRMTDKVLAKIWIIGRTYAATIERRKKKRRSQSNYNFAKETVAPVVIKSRIDKILKPLKNEKEITNRNILEILAAHKYVQDLFYKITRLEKRSLASKYLHFHLPYLFYLFDSRANKKIREYKKMIGKIPPEMKKIINSKRVDKNYALFYVHAFLLRNKIYEKYKIKLLPRQVDNMLLEV